MGSSQYATYVIAHTFEVVMKIFGEFVYLCINPYPANAENIVSSYKC